MLLDVTFKGSHDALLYPLGFCSTHRLAWCSRETTPGTYHGFLPTIEITAEAMLFLLMLVPPVALRVLLIPKFPQLFPPWYCEFCQPFFPIHDLQLAVRHDEAK